MVSLISFVVVLFFITFSYGRYTYETKYIDVPLDHYSFFDNRTFRLRYLINNTFWKPSYGPIFFYTGNEGSIELFAQNTGFLWEAAEKFKASIVFAEHRYYGESLPPRNYSKDSNYYSYLTIRQVLADYVDLLYELKNLQKSSSSDRKKRFTGANPVIAFGGSYGGMLAAWMRIKYPAVIEGALASSVPFLQLSGITPCDSYVRVLTNVFNDSSPQCVQNIKNAWRVLRETLSRNDGKQWIYKNWKLCEPITDESDVTQLVTFSAYIYKSVGMNNYPYPTDFLTPLPANPVKEMCKYLNSSLPDDKLLSVIFDSISVYLNYTGKTPCFNWTTIPSIKIVGESWYIQSCTELVMPSCANGETDMFEPSIWNLKQFLEYCYIYYEVIPKKDFLEKEYSGEDLRQASNIIFSNGLLDPWSGGGFTENVSLNTVVVVIPEAAHHLDLRASNENDLQSVVQARKLYIDLFRTWIKNYRNETKAADVEYDHYLNSMSIA